MAGRPLPRHRPRQLSRACQAGWYTLGPLKHILLSLRHACCERPRQQLLDANVLTLSSTASPGRDREVNIALSTVRSTRAEGITVPPEVMKHGMQQCNLQRPPEYGVHSAVLQCSEVSLHCKQAGQHHMLGILGLQTGRLLGNTDDCMQGCNDRGEWGAGRGIFSSTRAQTRRNPQVTS